MILKYWQVLFIALTLTIVQLLGNWIWCSLHVVICVANYFWSRNGGI